MKRRTLLKRAGIGIAGLGAGLFSRAALAAWGDQPGGVWPAASGPVRSILEIYLWGGMAPWETFYFRPGTGNTSRGFDADVSSLGWNAACPGTPAGLVSQFLANDSNGKAVHLGPFAKPLWRTDIASRLRVIVMQHDLAPHEAAIPYALSGRRLGRPGACGLGAPMQRRARALDATNAHPLPFSYCMAPDAAIGSPLFNMLDAVGDHGGNAKPVVIPIGSSTPSLYSPESVWACVPETRIARASAVKATTRWRMDGLLWKRADGAAVLAPRRQRCQGARATLPA